MEGYKYINKQFDNVAILSTLGKIYYGKTTGFSEDETYILEALKRVNPTLETKSNQEIGDYLQDMNEEQLVGLSNNVKGILHEIQFVEFENNDNDTITAALFTDTNHPGTDVILTNHATGEITEIQLKATDNSSYVTNWMENHSDGEILVTKEIAEKMDLETTGQSNEELTTDVNSFLEKLIKTEDSDSLWDYIPALPAISIAISSIYLFRLYKNGNISLQTLKNKFIKLTGIKVAKFMAIATLMMIPGINIIVGAGLLYSLLYGTGTLINNYVR